jgi:hypothetical protein
MNNIPTAKDIQVKPISSQDANKIVKRVHYSGKVVQNSILHLGVFLGDKLHGAMQFGNPIDKRKVLPFVKDTKWNNMVELNRMAFNDILPRNSESRALGVAFRLIKKNYPHIEWILSFSDGTQCGDGTIYRASGFHLIGINKNNTIHQLPNGEIVAKHGTSKVDFTGSKRLQGFQLRYIYFLNPKAKERLTVPIIPFSKIYEVGAGMYKGMRVPNSRNKDDQSLSEGANPIHTLHK